MGMDEQIAAALAGRVAQRDFIDKLVISWTALTDQWDSLRITAADLARTADEARSGHLPFSDLASYLAPGGTWRDEAAKVSARISASTAAVQMLRARVNRDTVNIGVIGLTHAGKSTLLRNLSGLKEDQIPSNQYDSTTATPSRIFHNPKDGPGHAVLTLHTWESFRAEVLEPLHVLAKLEKPAPATIGEFRAFQYDRGQTRKGLAGTERYLERLRIAHDSLSSYERLLTVGTMKIGLDQLRPYVAYPPRNDPRPHYRPYHAVQRVDIYCPFPQVGAVRLGLVDLPGAGEPGLDVHQRFLSDLRNNTDLLFIVNRPEKKPANDPDWDIAQLADDASAGVRRSDFAHLVINEDDTVPDDYYQQALARAKADAQKLGVDIRTCNLKGAGYEEAYEAILAPVLAMLADRLPYMDRDAAGQVLSEVADIVTHMRTLADQLIDWAKGRQADLPSEKQRLRKLAYELKNAVGYALKQVSDAYDAMFASRTPIAELHEQIEKAAGDMRKWMADGLGEGSRDEWLRTFREAESTSEHGRALDTRFNTARQQFIAEFGDIDESLQRSVDRLWGEVADALRGKLTESIVPTGADSRQVLEAFAAAARACEAGTIATATEQLLELPTDYGSIFLRVGRPVIRKVKWDNGAVQREAGLGVAIVAGAAGAAAGLAASAVAGPVVGATAGHLVGGAASGAASKGVRDLLFDQPGPGGASVPPADGGSAPAPGGELQGAEGWYNHLMVTCEEVTKELDREFHGEAQLTVRVLAAAVDRYKETVTSKPGVESEFEDLCGPVRREIWPSDFAGEAAQVAAELGALRQRASDVTAAADQVTALAASAGRL